MADTPQNLAPNMGFSCGSAPDLEDQAHGEDLLQPYISFYGPDVFESPPRATVDHDTIPAPLRRFTLSVAPIPNSGTYPYDAATKWLCNLDTEQLYTATDDGTRVSYEFGKDYVVAESGSEYCYDTYVSTTDGVYYSPIPVKGAPVEFRKVYFRGQTVDEYGKIEGCESGSGANAANTYFAYFACTQPVKQTCVPTGVSSDSESGRIDCAHNPRNDNFGAIEGDIVNWADFDIGIDGGGGGGGGCATSFSNIQDQYYLKNEEYPFSSVSYTDFALSGGCDNYLIFSGWSGSDGSCNFIDQEQIQWSGDESLGDLSEKYATVIKLFPGYTCTGISLCQPDGSLVQGTILFKPD